jgi:hypothetical protein
MQSSSSLEAVSRSATQEFSIFMEPDGLLQC